MDTPAVVFADREDVVVVRLAGTARIAAAGLLREKFLHAGINKNVVLDWEQAEHVDTSVLQVLLAIQKELAKRGLSLRVEKDSAPVRHYLELCGLADYFRMQPADSTSSPDGAPNV